jgi:uncharacterized repeat protein (TIGR01451 family)
MEKKPVKIKKTPPLRKVHLEESHEMEAGLRAIYGETPTDLHVVQRGGSRLTFWLSRLLIALGFGAVLVLAGVFLISRGVFLGKTYDPLEMSIKAPSEVKSGEMVTIEVPYANPKNIPLAALELDLNVPESFKLLSSTPAPTKAEELVYTLGSLGPRSDGVIKLEGLWLETAPSTTNLQVIANYRPANFDADFSEIASATITTNESVLTAEVKGPETASPGESVTYTVTVKQDGEVALENAELLLALPTGFTISSSVPPLEAGAESLLKLGTLAPKSETVVTFVGTFSSEVADVQQIGATLQIAATSSRVLTQNTSVWLTDVKGGDLRLSLVANGLSGTVAAEPGSVLRVSFKIENAGEAAIADASVLLDFQPATGVPIVWSQASLDGGVLSQEGVKFDAAKIGSLEPGGKKTFNLAFPIKPTLASGDLDTFTAIAKASTAHSTLLSSPISVNLNASVNFDVTAHYYSSDGAAIGSGPLPPSVSESTTFEIMWAINHALHPLEDLMVTATLPPGVSFAGNAASDMGKVSYDELTRTIRFEGTGIPGDAGNLHAKFFVSATPGEEDAGTFMKILSGSTMRVTDEATGARLDRTAPEVTTELPDDSFAAGKGTVSE